MKVNALPFSPMLPLAIIEIPVPVTLGFVLSRALFTTLYAAEPLSVLWSARRITLPSELIWLMCISLFKLAILTKAPEPLLLAVIIPSISVLIDFVKSRASAPPIPVQTPSAQGPTSLPIAPFVAVIFKSAPLIVWIKVLTTP